MAVSRGKQEKEEEVEKLRTEAARKRRHLLLAALVSVIVLAAVGFSAAGGGASVAKSVGNPYGATFPDGKYGEHYNPKLSVVKFVLGTPDALPTNPIEKNIALAALYRASLKPKEDLAYKCWKQNICSTGTGGKLTVGEADGFGGNPARQLFKMQFILQALTYPQIGKIIYTDANLNTQKAISDVRSMIAQHVNAIVSYPDAANALLPAYRAATQRKIPVATWS